MSQHTSDFEMDADTFRELGHRMIDSIADHLQAESQDPVLPTVTGEQVRKLFDVPAPQQGRPAEQVFEQAVDLIGSLSRRNGHPRFFGYVCASADPIGVLADALASAANQNLTAWRSSPGAVEMERQVVRWLDELLGFQGQGHGLLLSGGSAANAHGLACAVTTAREAAPDRPATIYLSSEAHLSLHQAAKSLGIADHHLRRLPVDAERRMSVADLEQTLAADLEQGLRPACVCASAGTANTGAVDPLEAIAEVCRRFEVWFHIDGAYGAPAALTDSHAHLRRGFALADSLSVDPHKWLFAPFDVGCSLVRDPEASHRAFSRSSEYIRVENQDDIERFAFFDHGPELSRRFRALKVWAILNVHGAKGLGREIQRHIDLRRYLDQRITETPQLEALGSDLSISCFRYRPEPEPNNPELSEEKLNALNRHILESLVAGGRFLLSPTTLDGRYSLRICIVNFRTTQADMDLLVEEVLRLGSGG